MSSRDDRNPQAFFFGVCVAVVAAVIAGVILTLVLHIGSPSGASGVFASPVTTTTTLPTPLYTTETTSQGTATTPSLPGDADSIAGTTATSTDIPSTTTTTTTTTTTPSGPVSIYLSNLEPVESDRYGTGVASIDGISYVNSVIIDPSDPYNSPRADYDIGRNCTRFHAMVGMLDDDHTGGPITYDVYADGTSIAEGEVNIGSGVPLDLDISGVLRLKLTIGVGASNEYYSDIYDGAYGDATVTCTSQP